MTIAEVAKKFDLTADTLRYYAKVKLIPEVGRTPGGIRDYTEADCRWIELIKCLRSAGLPIEMLAEYVRLFQIGDGTAEARKALLVEQRDRLEERILDMQKTLDRLNSKIERYEKYIIPMEHELKA